MKLEIPSVLTKVCDVSKREDIEQMVAPGVDALGGLDVLVNNAGIAGTTAPVEEMDPDAWYKVVQINPNGTFNVTRLAIPHVKKSQAGVIINMSSVAGRFGYANRSVYSTTKWGNIGFTKTLSIELGEYGIRANAILPGAVDGDRIQRVFEGHAEAAGKPPDEIKSEAMAAQSIKRLVAPRDIAARTRGARTRHRRPAQQADRRRSRHGRTHDKSASGARDGKDEGGVPRGIGAPRRTGARSPALTAYVTKVT